MFRIRRIYDEVLPINREALHQVKQILSAQFDGLDEQEIEHFADKLHNPFKLRFRMILFVAEDNRKRVLGFAILLHEPEIGLCYLDFIATGRQRMGGGIGGALYSRVRGEARALGVKGLFFECLPDDPKTCTNPEELKANKARLRFYETYGARPVVGTEYEKPLKPGDTCMPHLIYDGLDAGKPLKREFAKETVRAILERKYGHLCSPAYVKAVLESFKDDPVKLRELRYVKSITVKRDTELDAEDRIALVVNDRHEVHRIREQGYVESPVRIPRILKEIEKTGLFKSVEPKEFSDKSLLAVHDPQLIHYLQRACKQSPENESIYPYVFPIRNKTRPPKDLSMLAGYYCIDTFTPINRNVYSAARRGAECALTAAGDILEGRRIAYALTRPPGHHAEKGTFGGFCYLNNAAIAAQTFCAFGRVAILDIDYHHGNGQQDIFYRRSDVMTVSIHGHPRFAYPFFTGFEDERGEGDGEGFNLNIPLPEARDGAQYRKSLALALRRIEEFRPKFLVVALGLDTAKGDPTGTWLLTAKDFQTNGQMIGELALPVLVVQEGGYQTKTIGINARYFFTGLAAGNRQTVFDRRTPSRRLAGLRFSYEPTPKDRDQILRIVQVTEYFSPAETAIAMELIEDRLAKGEKSDYQFIIASWQGRTVGYVCYGAIAGTESSFDLYWIAVHPDFQNRGLGKTLAQETERLIREQNGRQIYVETSNRLHYAGTRAFYQRCGYGLISVMDDFYAPGDAKAVYYKVLPP